MPSSKNVDRMGEVAAVLMERYEMRADVNSPKIALMLLLTDAQYFAQTFGIPWEETLACATRRFFRQKEED